MSDTLPLDDDTGATSLWRAVLWGWLLQVAVLTAMAIVMREFIIADIDEGHGYEGDDSVRPPNMLTPGWLLEIGVVSGKLALAILPWALLLWAIMRRAERERPRPLGIWLMAGAVAALPLGFLIAIWMEIGANGPPPLLAYLSWSLVPAFLGTFSAAIARRIRHPARWR